MLEKSIFMIKKTFTSLFKMIVQFKTSYKYHKASKSTFYVDSLMSFIKTVSRIQKVTGFEN